MAELDDYKSIVSEYISLVDILLEVLKDRNRELSFIDEALARRPALEKYNSRYEKICAACTMAGRAETAEEKLEKSRLPYQGG